MTIRNSRLAAAAVLTAASVSVLAAASVEAQTQSLSEMPEAVFGVSRNDRFQLWTGCAPMRLSVYKTESNEAGLTQRTRESLQNLNEGGLTHESLQNLAESRLRAARLYDQDQGSDFRLILAVDVFGPAFTSQLSFAKRLCDNRAAAAPNPFLPGAVSRRLCAPAVTWETSSLGTIRSDGFDSANFILGGVSRMLDEFLVEYLRVNEAEC